MKEIKAFVHRGRAADIVHALLGAGFDQISLVDVKGTLHALTRQETEYSVEYGESVITEIKIEVVCDDGQVDQVLGLIRTKGRTAHASGWVYISEIEKAMRLDFAPSEDDPRGT